MGVRTIVVGVVAVATAGCGGASSSPPAEVGELHVVATTSILGDVVRHLVGDAGQVDTLMRFGTDPHSFQPSAAQVRRVEGADLVVSNGLGLEGRLLDALAATERRGTKVIRVAEEVDPLPYSAPPHADDHDEAGSADQDTSGAEHGSLDPHFWLDPLRMVEAVQVIAESLVTASPSVAETITANADAYAKAVQGLHGDIEQTLAAVPPPNRKLVTNHETLGYLAARYGFEIVGAVVPGGGTLADTSSQQLAELAEAMRRAGVGAIFVETTASPRLAETLSRELGRRVEVVELYTDSLGPEGASTYLDMMRTNARRIAESLGP